MMYFQTRLSYAPERDVVWRAVAEYLQRHIPKEAILLEIGAGYCAFVNNIKAKEKHALDTSNIIEEHKSKEVIPHIGSCASMPELKDGFFDVVFASNILEHLSYEDFQKTIAEVNRVLKKGGKFVIIQPNFKYCAREYFDDYTHRSVFTHISLCDALLACGFRINVLKPRFLPFTMKSSLSKFAHPALIKAYLKSPLKPFAKQMLVIAEKA